MGAGRESWARIGGVTAIAFAVGGLYFGFMKSTCSNPGFNRDLLSVGGFTLVGGMLAMAFEQQRRKQYICVLALVIAICLGSILITKFWLKRALASAFSAVKWDINYADPNTDTPEKHAEYWRNY